MSILVQLRSITRSDRLKRELAGVRALAATGIASVQELVEYIPLPAEMQSASSSVRNIFSRYLPEHGLVEYRVLPLFRCGFAVARLTGSGIALANEIGLEPAVSEWQILIDGHHGELQPEHTAMILAFAREARARDYRVQILPVPPPVTDEDTNKCVAYQPDLSICHPQYGRWYVEVQRRSRAKPGKWYRQMAHQSDVAFVTLTPTARSTLTKNIEAQHGYCAMWAADLQSLMRRRAADPNNPGILWNQIYM